MTESKDIKVEQTSVEVDDKTPQNEEKLKKTQPKKKPKKTPVSRGGTTESVETLSSHDGDTFGNIEINIGVSGASQTESFDDSSGIVEVVAEIALFGDESTALSQTHEVTSFETDLLSEAAESGLTKDSIAPLSRTEYTQTSFERVASLPEEPPTMETMKTTKKKKLQKETNIEVGSPEVVSPTLGLSRSETELSHDSANMPQVRADEVCDKPLVSSPSISSPSGSVSSIDILDSSTIVQSRTRSVIKQNVTKIVNGKEVEVFDYPDLVEENRQLSLQRERSPGISITEVSTEENLPERATTILRQVNTGRQSLREHLTRGEVVESWESTSNVHGGESETHVDVTIVQPIIHQVRRVRRVIRKVVIIDGKEHVTESVIEEPEQVISSTTTQDPILPLPTEMSGDFKSFSYGEVRTNRQVVVQSRRKITKTVKTVNGKVLVEEVETEPDNVEIVSVDEPSVSFIQYEQGGNDGSTSESHVIVEHPEEDIGFERQPESELISADISDEVAIDQMKPSTDTYVASETKVTQDDNAFDNIKLHENISLEPVPGAGDNYTRNIESQNVNYLDVNKKSISAGSESSDSYFTDVRLQVTVPKEVSVHLDITQQKSTKKPKNAKKKSNDEKYSVLPSPDEQTQQPNENITPFGIIKPNDIETEDQKLLTAQFLDAESSLILSNTVTSRSDVPTEVEESVQLNPKQLNSASDDSTINQVEIKLEPAVYPIGEPAESNVKPEKSTAHSNKPSKSKKTTKSVISIETSVKPKEKGESITLKVSKKEKKKPKKSSPNDSEIKKEEAVEPKVSMIKDEPMQEKIEIETHSQTFKPVVTSSDETSIPDVKPTIPEENVTTKAGGENIKNKGKRSKRNTLTGSESEETAPPQIPVSDEKTTTLDNQTCAGGIETELPAVSGNFIDIGTSSGKDIPSSSPVSQTFQNSERTSLYQAKNIPSHKNIEIQPLQEDEAVSAAIDTEQSNTPKIKKRGKNKKRDEPPRKDPQEKISQEQILSQLNIVPEQLRRSLETLHVAETEAEVVEVDLNVNKPESALAVIDHTIDRHIKEGTSAHVTVCEEKVAKEGSTSEPSYVLEVKTSVSSSDHEPVVNVLKGPPGLTTSVLNAEGSVQISVITEEDALSCSESVNHISDFVETEKKDIKLNLDGVESDKPAVISTTSHDTDKIPSSSHEVNEEVPSYSTFKPTKNEYEEIIPDELSAGIKQVKHIPLKDSPKKMSDEPDSCAVTQTSISPISEEATDTLHDSPMQEEPTSADRSKEDYSPSPGYILSSPVAKTSQGPTTVISEKDNRKYKKQKVDLNDPYLVESSEDTCHSVLEIEKQAIQPMENKEKSDSCGLEKPIIDYREDRLSVTMDAGIPTAFITNVINRPAPEEITHCLDNDNNSFNPEVAHVLSATDTLKDVPSTATDILSPDSPPDLPKKAPRKSGKQKKRTSLKAENQETDAKEVEPTPIPGIVSISSSEKTTLLSDKGHQGKEDPYWEVMSKQEGIISDSVEHVTNINASHPMPAVANDSLLQTSKEPPIKTGKEKKDVKVKPSMLDSTSDKSSFITVKDVATSPIHETLTSDPTIDMEDSSYGQVEESKCVLEPIGDESSFGVVKGNTSLIPEATELLPEIPRKEHKKSKKRTKEANQPLDTTLHSKMLRDESGNTLAQRASTDHHHANPPSSPIVDDVPCTTISSQLPVTKSGQKSKKSTSKVDETKEKCMPSYVIEVKTSISSDDQPPIISIVEGPPGLSTSVVDKERAVHISVKTEEDKSSKIKPLHTSKDSAFIEAEKSHPSSSLEQEKHPTLVTIDHTDSSQSKQDEKTTSFEVKITETKPNIASSEKITVYPGDDKLSLDMVIDVATSSVSVDPISQEACKQEPQKPRKETSQDLIQTIKERINNINTPSFVGLLSDLDNTLKRKEINHNLDLLKNSSGEEKESIIVTTTILISEYLETITYIIINSKVTKILY